jgi:hypothetical protein
MPTEASLSFEPEDKKSVAIAIATGGDYDGEKLYLNDASHTKGKNPKKHLDFSKVSFGNMKSRDRSQLMARLQEAFARGTPPEHFHDPNPQICEMYEELVGGSNKESSTTVDLPPDSQFHLVPSSDKDVREVWYIAGPSGSGKSYIAKGLAERYRKQFPGREVFLVSKLKEDETLDSTKGGPLRRLDIQKLVDNPIKDLEPLRDCMIIFDDYDTFTKPFAPVVHKLIDDIATMGRHTVTTMLCLSHYLSNYAKTRLLLCEATHFVLYPKATGNHALSYLLQTYLGFDKEETAQIRKIQSRWVCIHKNFPQWVVAEHTAKLLHTEVE